MDEFYKHFFIFLVVFGCITLISIAISGLRERIEKLEEIIISRVEPQEKTDNDDFNHTERRSS